MSPAPIRTKDLAGLPARPLQGQFYRIVPHYHRERILNTEGSERYGGRYNRKGTFGALYCGETPAVCAAEVHKLAAGRKLGPFLLASVAVNLQRVLDLTDQTILLQLGLQSENLVAPDWGQTQELGRLAREAGFEALLVPSAAAPRTNLVLFPDRLDSTSSVNLLAVEPTEL
jgi:RES domain-containing protein